MTMPATTGSKVAPVVYLLGLAALAWLAGATACLSTTPARYYTLAGDRPAASSPRGPARYTVHVAPAAVPETLDRPQLVLRVSSTELAVDDTHRWAEPLRTGVARAVAANLARELDGAQVSASEDASPAHASDVEVTVEVVELEIRLAEGVNLELGWTARWADGPSTRRGRSVAHARSAAPGAYDAAVAACAAALETASSDIARSLRSDHLSRQ
jgi:uncharacterized lipoprotein YmbA